MIKKLIVLTSIIVVFATACNKEDSPKIDNTVQIESQENSVDLRGGEYTLVPVDKPPSEDSLEQHTYNVECENDPTKQSTFFVYVENPCDDNEKAFTLKCNFSGNVSIKKIIWIIDGEFENEGTGVSSEISTNPSDLTNIKCIVIYEYKSVLRVLEIDFDAWSDEEMLIVKDSKAETILCKEGAGGVSAAVVAVFP